MTYRRGSVQKVRTLLGGVGGVSGVGRPAPKRRCMTFLSIYKWLRHLHSNICCRQIMCLYFLILTIMTVVYNKINKSNDI